MRKPWLAEELDEWERRGLRRRLRSIDGAQGPRLVVDGRSVVNLSSNDYLGLAADERLVAAATRALEQFGAGAGASRLIAGNMAPHRQFEVRMAEWLAVPRTLLFNSGYQANVGALQALAGPEDWVVSDELNHASIIDGCRLSRARVSVYRHASVEDAARALRAGRGARRRIVATDSLFSMDGDLAPLRELAALARDEDALLYVDEAHAIGVRGPGGRGVAAEVGVTPDVVVGTLGKALGSFGAFVAGGEDLIEWLANRARSFVFTTALPPAVVAAAEEGAKIAFSSEGDSLRSMVGERAEEFARGLVVAGLRDAEEPASHIAPLIVGDAESAMAVCDALLERGFFAQGIRPPTVPAGTARLRFALSAGIGQSEIASVLRSIVELADSGRIERKQ